MKRREKGNYAKCFAYLKESKSYFLIVLFLFLFSAIIGFLFPVFFVEFIEEFVRGLIEKTSGMNFFQLLIFIFQNNLTCAFFGMIFGLILGLFPILISSLNGYILGFVANKSVEATNFFSLLSLIPHGIFEIPALIISLGLVLRLGSFVFIREKRKEKFFYDFENSLRVFLFIVVPLLLIAAIIETCLIFLL